MGVYRLQVQATGKYATPQWLDGAGAPVPRFNERV